MIKMIQKLKNKKGFTLVELIVVIAIIAILTAVIVPLVGRYSAQARYNTLNDAAKTISNSAASAASDANQIGAVNKIVVVGERDSSDLTLSLTVDGTVIAAADLGDYKADNASGDSANLRFAKSLYASLKNAIPANSSFYVSLDKSDVKGVIYSADNTNNKITGELTEFNLVTGFDDAYTYTTTHKGDIAVGLAGQYITMAKEKQAPAESK